MRARFVQVGDLRTRYYEAGSGRPLVLLHGGGASADTWVRVIEPLAARHRVIAIDMIGHGFADAAPLGPVPQYTMREFTWRVLEACDADDGMILVGSAFGGLTAGLMQFDRPKRVAGLAIIGSGTVCLPPGERETMVKGALSNQLPALTDPTRDAIRRRNIGSSCDKTDAFEEIVLCQLTAFALPDRLKSYRDWVNGVSATEHDLDAQMHGRLEQITCPVLMIAGRQDPRFPAEVIVSAADRIPNARTVILEDCGHKPFAEQPEAFAEAVLTFTSHLA